MLDNSNGKIICQVRSFPDFVFRYGKIVMSWCSRYSCVLKKLSTPVSKTWINFLMSLLWNITVAQGSMAWEGILDTHVRSEILGALRKWGATRQRGVSGRRRCQARIFAFHVFCFFCHTLLNFSTCFVFVGAGVGSINLLCARRLFCFRMSRLRTSQCRGGKVARVGFTSHRSRKSYCAYS